MSMFELMLRPFIECIILVGIHSYLGLHVIRRRVIFVDLALAQIAALGAVVGGIMGIMADTPHSVVFSLVFCLIGAGLFAVIRVRHDRIPLEAIIGLVYAISFALAILVVQKTEGVEHMEDILVGRLLYVSWSDIITAAIAYSAIALLHIVFWKKFILISDFPEKAYRQGINIRLWDFLFYASFGFVITFSTKVAGVLLVFVFLVAPAILAVMITKRFGMQLLVGWVAGTVVTVLGLGISAHPAVDLPSGPSVVAFYGVVLVLSGVVVANVRARHHLRALAYTGLGFVGVGVLVVLVWLLGTVLGDPNALPGHAHAHMHAPVAATAAKPKAALDADKSELVEVDFDSEDDEYAFICKDVDAHKPKGMIHLVRFLTDSETPLFYCEEALGLLKNEAGKDFGFACDMEPSDPKRLQALKAMQDWAGELAGVKFGRGRGGQPRQLHQRQRKEAGPPKKAP
ncbi:MAG: metal ABC transporter permease [Deltaproteobacteria bacterium]|nr:metal ABC transporter permease [Deltaproteobacteria bacterium]